jgi:hypothetical protein
MRTSPKWTIDPAVEGSLIWLDWKFRTVPAALNTG